MNDTLSQNNNGHNTPLKVVGLQRVAGLMPQTLMAPASHAFGVNALPHRAGSPKYDNVIS